MTRLLLALYRSPRHSPLQHASNDRAIMDLTVARLEAAGWMAGRFGEDDVARGTLPTADLYLNMCQGSLAATALMALEESGALIVNRPTSALACHRNWLAERLVESGIPFPRTVIAQTDHTPDSLGVDLGRPLWIKRGDVHAERPEDVRLVVNGGLAQELRAFASRGIARVALQEHVPGPVLKFYGLADGSLFHAYDSSTGRPVGPGIVDLEAFRALAFAAADRLRLDIFGGDVAVPAHDRPVLVDLNDWPSFAPIRERAAGAIADYAQARHQSGVTA